MKKIEPRHIVVDLPETIKKKILKAASEGKLTTINAEKNVNSKENRHITFKGQSMGTDMLS